MFDHAKENLRTIAAELEEIINANEKSGNQWKKAIIDAKKDANMIALKMAEQTDPAAVAKLSEKKATAEAKLKALFDFREQAAGKPPISNFDYLALVDRIKAAAEDAEREALLTILDNYNANMAISDALAEFQESANALLKHLQHDIYKDSDMIAHTTKGKPFRMEMYRQKVNLWPVIHFGDISNLEERLFREMTNKASAYPRKDAAPAEE